MNDSEIPINQLKLPAVRAGMPVLAGDIQEIQNTINTLEKIYMLNVTKFQTVNVGDPLSASLMNQMFNSIVDLNRKVGINVKWECCPVKSGDAVTEKMFNELIGSTNLVIFKIQNTKLDVKKFIEFHQLRNRLPDSHIKILNIAWDYYREHNKCIPARLLLSKIDSPGAKDIVTDIGGVFIYETTDNGNKCYQITFLGVTVTNSYFDIEELLIKYLSFIKDKFSENPVCELISHEEVNYKLGLSREDSEILRKIISLARFSHGMSYSGTGSWSTSFPEDVEELRFVADIRSYIIERALKCVNLDAQVLESERNKSLYKQHSINGDLKKIQIENDIKPEPPGFIKNMVWIIRNWKRYWLYLFLAFVILLILRFI